MQKVFVANQCLSDDMIMAMELGTSRAKPTWRRKTEEERRKGHRAILRARLNPVRPLIVGIGGGFIAAGITAILFLLSSRGDLPFVRGISLAMAIIVSVIFAILTYIGQAVGWVSLSKRLRLGICDRCFKFTTDGIKDHCNCGGTFEDADGWTLNYCPKCGYDLRASGEKCPECGALLRPELRASP